MSMRDLTSPDPSIREQALRSLRLQVEMARAHDDPDFADHLEDLIDQTLGGNPPYGVIYNALQCVFAAMAEAVVRAELDGAEDEPGSLRREVLDMIRQAGSGDG
ncbi:MAG: hypothetical protein AAGH15_05220 [Myxococcota bacterium]